MEHDSLSPSRHGIGSPRAQSSSSAVVRVLGSAPVAGPFMAVTRGRLRSVTFHEVSDPRPFALQLDWLADRFRSVSAAEVALAQHSRLRLPANSVWITFDDGDESVIRNAMPLLVERGLTATAFLCGGWVGTQAVPWWKVLEEAAAADLLEAGDVGSRDLTQARIRLKRVADTERRRVVDMLTARLDAAGRTPAARQWSDGDVAAWLAAGHDIGNHSWDHPVIDRCDDDEQRRQVQQAHDRLSDLAGRSLDVWAWPNGDEGAAAADHLRQLGYQLIATYDHRLARRRQPFAVSRLRLDAGADMARTRAIVSGVHSVLFHATRRRGKVVAHDD